LDKLKIALRDRGHILGVEVKQKIPKEMPFGECKIFLLHAICVVYITVWCFDVIYLNVGNVNLMICGIYFSGWMQNLQERASEWDDWDELVDRGSFLVYRKWGF